MHYVAHDTLVFLVCIVKKRWKMKKRQQHQAFTTKGDDDRPFLSHLVPTTNSHLLLVIGEWHSRAKCLFSLHVFSLLTSMWCANARREREREAKLVKIHRRGTRFAQVARKQPFHLLHSEAAWVNMKSTSKAAQQPRWQWVGPVRINTDTNLWLKWEYGDTDSIFNSQRQRHMADNQWFSVWYWKFRWLDWGLYGEWGRDGGGRWKTVKFKKGWGSSHQMWEH